MADTIRIAKVSLFPAGRVSRRSGLYGWLTYEVDGVPVFDGATLRRTPDGRFYVSRSTSENRGGTRWIKDAAIEAQILGELRRQGVIAA